MRALARWLARKTPIPSLFTRSLGGVYLCAFTSLRAQVLGLYGQQGISPIANYLALARTALDRPWWERLRLVPSVFWRDASDAALLRACRTGQVCAVLSMLGIAPRLTAFASWALYLSFVSTGREFLSFQWDALLLETGLAAMVITPPRGTRERPPGAAVALMRFLAFRLYFESGLSKVASHDPTWRDGTACCYHYGTQPLPTSLGWHANQLPRSFQRFSTYAALALELGAPVLAFAPRRWRRRAFALLAGLQGLIAATGNYGFFNLLTVVDSLWLLSGTPARRAPWRRRLKVAVAAAPLLAIAVAELAGRLFHTRPPRSIERLRDALAPFDAVNPYGLFAVMTTERPEIVIEGSLDGTEWREYHFRYKPTDLHARPRFVAPHQPRLDWQMWFAALGRPPPWFGALLVRLLQGEPAVLSLLASVPFSEPPTYVRALLYRYKMTDRATRQRTGAWWERELVGLYVPPVALGPRE